jgi:hypothetical protein
MLLITTFVELRVVAGRSRTQAGRPQAVSGRPMLSHTCHAMPMPSCAVALRSRFQNGMVVAWHGRGMACVNQTRPHCVNQMRKTQSKPLMARHGTARQGNGMSAAWERHGVCELVFRVLLDQVFHLLLLHICKTFSCTPISSGIEGNTIAFNRLRY